MQKYGIGDCVSFKLFNRETGETVLEGKGLSNVNISSKNKKQESNLIPFKMKFNDKFEATIYVDEETALKFYELGKEQSK